ncbi:MAG TPA: alpha-2-macroglobulin family protein, partial [Sediminibacterium sp.]
MENTTATRMRVAGAAAPMLKNRPAFSNAALGEADTTTYDMMSAPPPPGNTAVPEKNTAADIPVQVRKNLTETAFFFPQLYADSSGKYSFSFTMPEALTRWKWMSFAHTKELATGMQTATIITQKELMVQPNAPRFLREGDNMEFISKIVNMGNQELKGQATLELIDATTHTSVDGWFQNIFPSQYFTVAPGQSMVVKFPIQVPFSYNRPLTWRIIAKAGNTSDGEENTLPVLTNRVLVTESLPLLLKKDTTQSFRFEKLLNNNSESLSQQDITVEYTSNPVWYAVQALPYLIEYPYECSEQSFNRFYATTLSSFILNKHPRIRQVFEQWKKDSTALLSNLQKNEELKQVLLQETPWVMQAENEAQQKKNLALLMDMAKLASQSETFLQKLQQLQLPNGSFSWFKGGMEDRYITNYILTGIGKLKQLGALAPGAAARLQPLIRRALDYLDSKLAADYDYLVKNKSTLSSQHVSGTQIDYLYMRSFFRNIPQQAEQASEYYYGQAKRFWISFNNYYRAQIGLISYRNKETRLAYNTILPALVENAGTDTEKGMFWKNTLTSHWYQSPVEYQGMMIAFMSEISQGAKDNRITGYINDMKTWLLLNKQTNHWGTTIATADACYAILLNGSDWLNTDKTVTIRLGNTTTVSNINEAEAGTGYFKKRIDGRLVNNQMGDITVSVYTTGKPETTSPSWGSVYWQYFEDMDKITSASSPLSVTRKLFIEKNTDKGKQLQAVADNEELAVGDKVIIRLEIRSDRDMDYVHLKDTRAASMEPMNVLSGYRWQGGLGYYESTRDTGTDFFFGQLNKGTYVFEYPVYITHTGIFSSGMATIQCMYAPEFTGHSEGGKVRVRE